MGATVEDGHSMPHWQELVNWVFHLGITDIESFVSLQLANSCSFYFPSGIIKAGDVSLHHNLIPIGEELNKWKNDNHLKDWYLEEVICRYWILGTTEENLSGNYNAFSNQEPCEWVHCMHAVILVRGICAYGTVSGRQS